MQCLLSIFQDIFHSNGLCHVRYAEKEVFSFAYVSANAIISSTFFTLLACSLAKAIISFSLSKYVRYRVFIYPLELRNWTKFTPQIRKRRDSKVIGREATCHNIIINNNKNELAEENSSEEQIDSNQFVKCILLFARR